MPQLFVNKIESIGAVDAGDNPEADIVFWKALPGSLDERMTAIRAAWADQYRNDQAPFGTAADAPDVDSIFNADMIVRDAADYFRVRYLIDAAGNISFGSSEPVALETAIVAKERFLEGQTESAVSAEQTRGNDMDSFEIHELPEVAQEEFGKLQTQLDEALLKIEALETPPEEEPEDALAKASDEVQALIADRDAEITKRDEELAKARAELAEVELAKRDAEFVKRVSDDELEVLLGKADEVGPVLRELADAAPDAFDSLYKNMQAAAQRVDLAGTLAEIGEDQGEIDPLAKRDAWVSKMRKDGDSRSVATLRTDFWETHPDERAALRESK